MWTVLVWKPSEFIETKVDSLEELNLDPMLTVIAEEVRIRHGLDVVTSHYRPGDKGVHGTQPVRGLDIRCHDWDLGIFIENEVNYRWEYDWNRPYMKVALYHDVGKGIHLHLQAHCNTRLRGGV